jgi:hypothetical protein
MLSCVDGVTFGSLALFCFVVSCSDVLKIVLRALGFFFFFVEIQLYIFFKKTVSNKFFS